MLANALDVDAIKDSDDIIWPSLTFYVLKMICLRLNVNTGFVLICKPGESINRPNPNPNPKKCCSLNTKTMVLKTVLYYSRYVQLGSVIHPALISRSFLSIREIFRRETPFANKQKIENNEQNFRNFPLFSFRAITTQAFMFFEFLG